MSRDGDGPASIRSLAVTADDVVTAVEARRQRGGPVVLRVTPPFSGRMRARLHVPAEGAASDDGTLHVEPAALLDETAPPYPRPTDTEDELRADSTESYTVERHHERHERALEAWRRAVRDHFVEETTIETTDGRHRVSVVVLG